MEDLRSRGNVVKGFSRYCWNVVFQTAFGLGLFGGALRASERTVLNGDVLVSLVDPFCRYAGLSHFV